MTRREREGSGNFTQPNIEGGFDVYLGWVKIGNFDQAIEAEQLLRAKCLEVRPRLIEIDGRGESVRL